MSFFKSLLKIIAIVLIIIAIIYLIVAFVTYLAAGAAGSTTALGVLMLGATSLTVTQLVWLAIAALVLAAIADPKTVSKFVSKVAEGIGTVVTSLGNGVGTIIGAGLKGLLSSPWVWLIGGVILYTMLPSRKESDYGNQRTYPRDEGPQPGNQIR